MKTGKTPPTSSIRVVDRGDWAVIRIPASLLNKEQREQVTKYLYRLPYPDRRFSGAIESWCIRSSWMEPVVELIEHVVGHKVPVEG